MCAIRIYTLALSLALAVAMSPCALSACARDYVAYTSHALGYNAFVDSQGHLAGAGVDIYNELARRVGCKITIEDVPPGRLDALNKDDRVAILALGANRHRPNRIFLPLVSMTTDLLIRRDLNITSAAAAHDNPKVTFGRVDGLTYGDWGNTYFAGLPPSRVDQSPNVEVLYRKLGAARIDATFGFSVMYLRNYEENDLAKRVQIIPLPEAPRLIVGVVLSQALVDKVDVKQFETAVDQIRGDGTMERILAHWIGNQAAHEQIWRADRDGGQ